MYPAAPASSFAKAATRLCSWRDGGFCSTAAIAFTFFSVELELRQLLRVLRLYNETEVLKGNDVASTRP